MKQSKDPFEVAFEEQEESPPDSPIAHDETESQTAQPPLNSQGDDVDNSIHAINPPASMVASASTSASARNTKNKDEDDEEEEENMDVELGKFPATGDPDKMAKMHSNTSGSSSTESENWANSANPTNMFEDMSIYDIIMQEMNSPASQYLKQYVLDQASSSNHRNKKRKYINREREIGEDRIMRDYFVDNPVYTDFQFRKRFRMRKHLFLRIVNDLENRYTFFQRRVDATGRRSFSAIHKCTAVLRMLAYGCPADMLDETVRMGETTLLTSLREFVKGIREVYGETYLRRPDAHDTARLLQIGEARGFPGMLGSIGCMHWEWENYPITWHGQHTMGDIKNPTLILEAVASHDLWIWNAFFGVVDLNNDISVLNQSPLFTNHLQGIAPAIQFQANGQLYNFGYYLADDIYPKWAAFVKTIPLPQSENEKLFASFQEGARKDVERAFEVLQSRFAIVRGPVKLWDTETLANIMYACIILHNMIVEDERDQYNVIYDYDGMEGVKKPTMDDVTLGAPAPLAANILQINEDIQNKTVHHQLQRYLLWHIWQKFGGN